MRSVISVSQVPSAVDSPGSASSLASSINSGVHTAMHVRRAVEFTSPSSVGGFSSFTTHIYH